MANVAKINLLVERCMDCPYCRKPQGYAEFYCQHDLRTPGVEVGDGERVPDYCPFVIERLKGVLEMVENGGSGAFPKKLLKQIERKQIDDPNPKFGADHSFRHARRVSEIGVDFLEHCVGYGFSSPNTVLKEKLLFQIAAWLHDIGLADSVRNHEIHSAELAKKFLTGAKIDIDAEDADVIVHAVANHSKGDETQTIVDAALILADKLDVTSDRIVRLTDGITREVQKIQAAEFKFYGKLGQPKGAELRYMVDEGFDRKFFRIWPKAIQVPYRLTTEYFGLEEFRFLINGEPVELKGLCG
ncbi:HD domain-containing protein [Candidatus Saccharibacteria bacterium]|nr:HD domain-containing protein [Candidatus Saccharibacteria bacterium]